MDTRRYRTKGWQKKYAIRRIELGQRIRKYRKKLCLSQEELAEEIGLTRTSVVNIESGKQEPPISALPEICQALEITAGRLVNHLDD